MSTKDFIVNYWSQLTVVLGIIGYILKTTFDYRLKNKELRFKYFYELKAKKVIEIYSKIVEIQMIIDRRRKDESNSFENTFLKEDLNLTSIIGRAHFI